MSKIEAERYLTKCKIALNSNFLVEMTEKNKQTITKLGFTEDDIREVIMDLKSNEYIDGPVHDKKGYKGDFWIFGRTIQCLEIYIKLKVKDFDENGEKRLTTLCISFHETDRPLTYKFK